VAGARDAIVIRTGQRAESDLVCARLSAAGVKVIECADAIDACVHILRFPDPAPHVVFIGTEWLSREDYALMGYLRQTWPGVLVVLHGEGYDTIPLDRSGPTAVCPTLADLKQLLSGGLDEMVEAARREASGVVRLRGAPRAVNIPQDAEGARVGSAVKDDGPEQSVADSRRIRSTVPREKPVAVGPNPPRTILTEEELDALLRDSGA